MSWLSNLWSKIFRTKQDGGFGSSMIADLGVTGRPPRRDTATSIEAYNAMPINRAIVDRISGNVAANRWRLFQTSPSTMARSMPRELREFIHQKPPEQREKTIQRLVDGKELTEVQDHPILNLMRKPNPTMSGFEYRKVEQVWMEQAGEGFTVIERGRNANGKPATTGEPTSMWPIVPWWVTEIPSEQGQNFKIRGRTGTREVPPENMIWMRFLNPSNPYGRGSGIAQTLNNELDADEYAAITTSMRMFNNGIPEVLIVAEGMRDKSVEVFKEEWRKQRWPGYLRSSEPHFTNAKNLKIEKIQESLVDLNLVGLREFLTKMQINAWGVPPEILGLIENSNRATINSAQFLYACNVLMPRLMLWENTLNEDLVPMFGRTDLLLLFDNPIPEDREFALEVTKAHSYAASVDEIRELAELPPLETAKSALHAVPNNLFLESFEEGVAAPVQPVPEEEEPAEEEEEEQDDNPTEEEGDEDKAVVIEILEPVEISEKRTDLKQEEWPRLLAGPVES